MKIPITSELFNMKEFIYPVVVLSLATLLILSAISKNKEITKLEKENQKYFEALMGCMLVKGNYEKRIRY
jgi:preprotein translocase subunit Sec63